MRIHRLQGVFQLCFSCYNCRSHTGLTPVTQHFSLPLYPALLPKLCTPLFWKRPLPNTARPRIRTQNELEILTEFILPCRPNWSQEEPTTPIKREISGKGTLYCLSFWFSNMITTGSTASNRKNRMKSTGVAGLGCKHGYRD